MKSLKEIKELYRNDATFNEWVRRNVKFMKTYNYTENEMIDALTLAILIVEKEN